MLTTITSISLTLLRAYKLDIQVYPRGSRNLHGAFRRLLNRPDSEPSKNDSDYNDPVQKLFGTFPPALSLRMCRPRYPPTDQMIKVGPLSII